jgi:hypothetical protein
MGAGKSALAAVVAERLVDVFPGGVAWIPCDGLTGDEGLAELWERAAQQVGFEEIASIENIAERQKALAEVLDKRPLTFLVLDNIEVAFPATDALNTLARQNRTVVLLTARTHVAPQKAHFYDVPPLNDTQQQTASGQILTSSPAKELCRSVLHRVDKVRPNADDESKIDAFVTALDHLPYAIELEASYVAEQHLPLVTGPFGQLV